MITSLFSIEILCSQFVNINDEPRELDFLLLKDFQRDLDKLGFASLPKDLETLKSYLRVDPRGRKPKVERCSGLGQCVEVEIYKVREFRCKDMRGKGARSGIRIIYAYIPEDKVNDKVIFIEMYSKSKKDNFDKKRILQYFRKETGPYYTVK